MSSQTVATHCIETPRLVLRTHELSDAPALVALLTNPANVEHDPMRDGPEAHTVALYEDKIREWNGAAARGESALFVVALRDTGAVIGLGGFPWLPANAAGRAGNTGLLIDSAQSGKGYAREAMVATLDYGFDVLGFERIEQSTHKVNEQYRGFMRALGFEPRFLKESTDSEGRLWCDYLVSREEWQQVKAETAAKKAK